MMVTQLYTILMTGNPPKEDPEMKTGVRTARVVPLEPYLALKK